MNDSFLPEWDPSPYPSFDDLKKENEILNKEWTLAERTAETRLKQVIVPGIGYIGSLALAVNYGIPSGNPVWMTLSITASLVSTGILQHYVRSFLCADACLETAQERWFNSIKEKDHCFERITKE